MRLSKVLVTTAALSFGFVPAVVFAQNADQSGHEKGEHAVTLSEVPDPVRRAIEQQAEGGQVIKVEQETKDGKSYYHAWIKKGDQKYESVIDSSGKVLRYEKYEKKGDEKKRR